jgi:hypothetical protein
MIGFVDSHGRLPAPSFTPTDEGDGFLFLGHVQQRHFESGAFASYVE